MQAVDLEVLLRNVVQQARELKDKHTAEYNAPVNYAAIFTQSIDEYQTLLTLAKELGSVVQETRSGPVFDLGAIRTVAGRLRLVKVRQPDKTRPELGDADFTVSDYPRFKAAHLSKPGFKLIERPGMEMIELIDPLFKVRAYFSHPPLDKQLGLV
ncbi:MAG: hypothetical protein HY974_01425 [Candidatus Kerfeldbacteria bacterium]|nr:hypothetical protein [Candidatus Kerfeldbacteria bacterium]